MAVITISRQYGSGGDKIAARVCEMLGYRFFDKRLMAQVASEVGLSEQEIVDFSEDNYKVRGFLERLFGGRSSRTVAQVRTWIETPSGLRTAAVRELDENQAIDLVRSAIRAAYEQGNVVIVGRGGQAILKEKADVLHVRIEAPLDMRLERVQVRENITLAPAAQREVVEDIVAQRDAAAADYLKRFYDVDWSDPSLYHLVINAGRLGTEAVAHLIVSVVSHLPVAGATG